MIDSCTLRFNRLLPYGDDEAEFALLVDEHMARGRPWPEAIDFAAHETGHAQMQYELRQQITRECCRHGMGNYECQIPVDKLFMPGLGTYAHPETPFTEEGWEEHMKWHGR